MPFQKSTSTFSDAFGTLAMRVVGIALAFVSTAVAARLFGPAEYGAYSAALALASLLAAIAPVGSGHLLVRNLSTIKDPDEAGRETAIAHLCTAYSTALLIAVSLVVWSVSRYGFKNDEWARTSMLALIMFVPRTVMSLRQWLAIPLIGSRRAVMPEQTTLPFLFIASLLLMAAAGWKLTATSAAVVNAVTMLAVWIISSQTGPIRSVYQSSLKSVRQTCRLDVAQQFRNGLPFVSVGIGNILSQSCMPIVIAAACGFEQTAYFALAFSCAALATIPLSAFNLTMISTCARFYKQGDFLAAQHAVRSAATVTFVLSVVVSIAIWLGSPLLVTLLGAKYESVCRLLPLLLLTMIVDCLTGPTNPVMLTMKMENTHSRTIFALIPIQFGTVYLMGKVVGIEGAAFAFLASRCLWNIVIFTRIYQVRGLVMLPYLGFRSALRESSSVSENELSLCRCEQSYWRSTPNPEVSASHVRAA